jgi:hypothetical protein
MSRSRDVVISKLVGQFRNDFKISGESYTDFTEITRSA